VLGEMLTLESIDSGSLAARGETVHAFADFGRNAFPLWTGIRLVVLHGSQE
jgi:hypothetical protein